MNDKEFADLLSAYEDASQEAAKLRHDAALCEIGRSEWVAAETAKLIEAGVPKTVADKQAHSDPIHRERQREIADITFDAKQAEAKATALELALKWEVAGREVAHV